MTDKAESGFSSREREAMKQRANELAAEGKGSRKRAEGEEAVRKALDAMEGTDRELGTRIHQLVSEVAPHLWPKTWYGFPAYAIDGKTVVCFFQSAAKAEERYATLGFTGAARLDDGNLWPTSFALNKIGPAEEGRIRELLSRASAD